MKSIKKIYDQEFIASDFIKFTGLWPEENKIFDRHFKGLGKVLDLGCGAGRTSFWLAALGNEVEAVDFSRTLIKAAQKRLAGEPSRISFIVKDVRKLTYPEGTFEGAAFSYNGIGHIPGVAGKKELLARVWKILKPGGVFFFTAHDFWSVDGYLVENLKSMIMAVFKITEKGERTVELKGCKIYLDIKSRREWAGIVKSSGFEIMEFNSRKGIRESRNISFWDRFGRDNFFFFILRKPS